VPGASCGSSRSSGLVVEYEGRQHREDDAQYETDIVRYERLRRANVPYVQITDPTLRSPRAVVLHVHQELVASGYRGPAPSFGARWRALFAPAPVDAPSRER
jgi:hypothetical protein